MVLVAIDSAVSQVVEECTLIDTTTDTATYHFWLVFIAWGAPLVVLLAQVWRTPLLLAARSAALVAVPDTSQVSAAASNRDPRAAIAARSRSTF